MDADVAVVGLGTAGAAAAALCAERGLRVVGLEAGALDEAGARWVNGVPAWSFEAAGLPRPSGEALLGADVPLHLIAGWDGPRRTIGGPGHLEVDMRALVRSLQARARVAGAELRDGVRVRGAASGGVETDAGAVRARWIVDAAGLAGPRLLGQPVPDRSLLCVAAQQVLEVADARAAREFFEQRGVKLGEALIFSGVAGGYSIVNIRAHGETASLLTGSIPADGHPSGGRLLDDFVAENRWLGGRRFGGGRALPLRRPYLGLGRGRLALIGDAAAQVHPAHGSGIAMQLVAARQLADALTRGAGPHAYDLAFQRRYGGRLAAADLFRRFSSTLTPADLEELFQAGALPPTAMNQVLFQHPARPPLAELARAALGLRARPDLAVRLGPLVARMRAVEAHYRLYPPPGRRRRPWRRVLERISGLRYPEIDA